MKYNSVLDLHTHTIVSGHAYSTLREMAKAASDKGLELLGITEHAPKMPGTCHLFYFDNLRIVPRELYGIELVLGSEVNILDAKGTVDLPQKAMEKLDIIIASLHTPCMEPGSRQENTEAYLNVMKNPCVNIIGHPDDGRYEVDYEALVQGAKEYGKIRAFARGARRLNNPLMAAVNPFVFGQFQLYEGRTSYTISQASVQNYFSELLTDFEGSCYGQYFLEFADYYTRENNDEKEMLKLLYVSLKALTKGAVPHELVQYIFEMKALVVNGEFPGVLQKEMLLESTVYTIQYVMQAPFEKLYTFKVSDAVLQQLAEQCRIYRDRYIGHRFKSLAVLENCRLKN